MIIFGDCRDTMRQWAKDGIKAQTCVTSPPYYGLRDYGHDGQIGLEETPEEYIKAMVEVFRCVWDVLEDDGTLWLNIGDSYAGNNSRASNNGRAGFGNAREKVVNRTGKGLKTKDLIGIPWMLAFALRAEGWYLRQDIIWHKPNPMPESVQDRCTKAHEYIFLLSKSSKYYYDIESIKEKAHTTNSTNRNSDKRKLNNTPDRTRMAGLTTNHYEMKNKRSVWTVTTKPYSGAHFATFPTDLIEPCIKAGCPEGGVVLDPFMGSGTTAYVAALNGRKYLGCELNSAYKPLQDERIKNAEMETAQMSLI
jgi:DNA modification methylase